MKMTQEDSTFYMAINDPKYFRRELLGSSKFLIKLLQRYENIKELRQKKIKLMYDFSKVNQEINMLVGKLKNVIPKTKLRNMPKRDVEKVREEIPKRVSRPEMESLKNELQDIEKKLESLE